MLGWPDNEKVVGVMLSDGSRIESPVVVNATGPHSFVINRMAGIEEKMNIKTRALRHEVHFVPSPDEFIYECENGRNHDEDPVQVKLRHVDFTLDTGIFSRNREIIANSTFSVLG